MCRARWCDRPCFSCRNAAWSRWSRRASSVDVLQDLLARCAIATLMYQSSHAAHDSSAEHAALVECFAAGNVTRAVKLMREHLDHVEAGLKLDQPVPSHDVKSALAPV